MPDVFTLRERCTCHSRCHGNRVHRKPKGDPSSHSVGVQPRFLAPFNVCPLLLVAKDVNILFDELEAVNSPCKDDDSLLHPGNLTSTSEDASRLEAGGEVRVCRLSWKSGSFRWEPVRRSSRPVWGESHQAAGSGEACFSHVCAASWLSCVSRVWNGLYSKLNIDCVLGFSHLVMFNGCRGRFFLTAHHSVVQSKGS